MRPRLGIAVKFAVISDIHANLPALDAVLEALPEVDLILCCGDTVGYYPYVNEVCDRLQEKNVIAIRGNHDAYALGFLQPDPAKQSMYYSDWTRSQLSERSLQWLHSLPVEKRIEIDQRVFLLRHASPWDEVTYVYKDSPALSKIHLQENEVLILGHTHHPMLVRAGAGVVLNPGSVGQPRDWNPAPSFALIDTKSGLMEHRRVDYDFKQFQKYLQSIYWNQALIDILSRTKG